MEKPAKKLKRKYASTDDFQRDSFSENEPVMESDDDRQNLKKTGGKTLIIASTMKFTCSKCRISYTNIEDLQAHFEKCKIGKELKKKTNAFCDKCGLKFESASELDAHIGATHVRAVKTDSTEVLPSHLALLNHFKEHDGKNSDEPKICEVCAEEFSDKSSFEKHMQVHQQTKDSTDEPVVKEDTSEPAPSTPESSVDGKDIESTTN